MFDMVLVCSDCFKMEVTKHQVPAVHQAMSDYQFLIFICLSNLKFKTHHMVLFISFLCLLYNIYYLYKTLIH